MVEGACGIDRRVNACLAEIQRELREIFAADVVEWAAPEVDVGTMFDQLDGVVGRGASGEPRPDEAGASEKLRTDGVRFVDDSRALLNELAAERAQVQQLRVL